MFLPVTLFTRTACREPFLRMLPLCINLPRGKSLFFLSRIPLFDWRRRFLLPLLHLKMMTVWLRSRHPCTKIQLLRFCFRTSRWLPLQKPSLFSLLQPPWQSRFPAASFIPKHRWLSPPQRHRYTRAQKQQLCWRTRLFLWPKSLSLSTRLQHLSLLLWHTPLQTRKLPWLSPERK